MSRLDCQYTRRHYDGHRLLLSDVLSDPIEQFIAWYRTVEQTGYPDLNAMVLSTVDEHDCPDSRVVLLKEIDEVGFVFYTNYDSEKAQQLQHQPQAALNFYWPTLTRQVRIRGQVTRISAMRSAAYFASRDRASQLAVYASQQSKVTTETELDIRLGEVTMQFANHTIPCPAFWGGYCVEPFSIEFFQGQAGRLHDRIRYQKQANGNWLLERLNP
ncbi:MAG: pyridoxamine 5'-phosphate oxidase [Gammaproteobacteria bacterium]